MTAPSWRCEVPADAIERARRWITSAALGRVLDAFGSSTQLKDLSALATWSSAVLDTRSGAERQLAAPVTWNEGQVEVLLQAARPLGLLATAGPQRSSYDCTVVMGGTVTANRLRSAIARRFLDQGVNLGVIAALGADRELMPWETTVHDDVRHPVEWTDLAAVLAAAFDLAADITTAALPADVPVGRAHGHELRALAAPASHGRTRANSADALDYLAERVGFRRLLIVTSAIYAPYTYFVAARVLDTPFEVVGTPTSAAADRSDLAQRVGQELHSTIKAVAALT